MHSPNGLWYKDAIVYELPVRAFRDSNGDGRGDFPGLTRNLDYLQDLGVTAIWLLPFYPSPLKDDGYDIADYTDVHANYGTLQDFDTFLREAHRRGLRVITELVINHTSDQHPWFRRARRSPPGSPERDFYVWSDTPERYTEARIIFQDYESSNWAWDPVAGAYYWHRFYNHQPDLNYDNPAVRQKVLEVADFWLEKGVDGLRLDAIPYLYQREGTNCENLPEVHAFLKDLRRHVDQKYQGRMFLAEANQWPEDACAYFGAGDECHMAFHFPLMPRLFIALHTEDAFPIQDIMAQTPPIPDNSQWALFLRNHDELTLEMVSEEERGYMTEVYAFDQDARINLGIRRRLAPLLNNNRRRIELLNALLLSLPGTPVIYYGDEIGMGDNVYLGDRNGVRTPMQWSADQNAGFSDANPQRLYLPPVVDPEYHYQAVNVRAQRANPQSLLNWTRRLIALRKRYRAFSRGTLEFRKTSTPKILAYIRRHAADAGEEAILVVANLSRFAQHVEIDLGGQEGKVPVELFGRLDFPPVGDRPYYLMLGPHSFYWFALEPARPTRVPADTETSLPTLAIEGDWQAILTGSGRTALEALLPGYLLRCRWFGGGTRSLRQVRIHEVIPCSPRAGSPAIALLEADYHDGQPDQYLLPLALAEGPEAEGICRTTPQAALARLSGGCEGLLYDAVYHPVFCTTLLDAIAAGRQATGLAGELRGVALPEVWDRLRGEPAEPLEPVLSRAEQSNSSIIFGERLILKLFRRVEGGINPDLEVSRFLTEEVGFAHTPDTAGWIEYRNGQGEQLSLGILQRYVPGATAGWEHALTALGQFYGPAQDADGGKAPSPGLWDLESREPPPRDAELLGPYREVARLLGRRTAEMHLALAGDPEAPAFAPEPFSALARRALYQSLRTLALRTCEEIGRRLPGLPEDVQEQARNVLDRREQILTRFRAVVDRPLGATRIRCHGDYHLGQVLWADGDFTIIDFEGEPRRPLRERRLKGSPLRDVAGMIRSFHYAAHAALGHFQADTGRPTVGARLEPWARCWYRWVSAAFLGGYREKAEEMPGLLGSAEARRLLLDTFLLEKAIYEVGYELDHRPDWVGVPVRGVLELLETGGES